MQPADKEAIQVVYVTGGGRSGSTLLDRMLGSVEGVTSFNELRWTWQGGAFENHVCSCGKIASECEFWVRVLAEMRYTTEDMRTFVRLQREVETYRMFLPLYFGLCTKSYRRKLEQYREGLGRLYRAIAKVSGSRTIIDSTKTPPRALILAGVPDLRISVIHLVRNAVAVVNSWQKQNYKADRGARFRSKPFVTAIALWALANTYAEMLRSRLPYIRIRYEDLCANPRTQLSGLCEAISPLSGRRLDFIDDQTINLRMIHSLSGNPDRFSVGPTVVRPEMGWQVEVPAHKAFFTKVLTFPWLFRYNYL